VRDGISPRVSTCASFHVFQVLDFAIYLGMDPREDAEFLWMAEECLAADLPSGWTEQTSSRGDIYFYNR
jgi:hypothetical protein